MSKYEKLEEHLLTGEWISPLEALQRFGISPSAYHRRISDFKERNPGCYIEWRWVRTPRSRYKKHRAIFKKNLAA